VRLFLYFSSEFSYLPLPRLRFRCIMVGEAIGAGFDFKAVKAMIVIIVDYFPQIMEFSDYHFTTIHDMDMRTFAKTSKTS
jgi:hypothetical protein